MNAPDVPDVKWFAIRTIYLFGKKQDDTNIFEERVVVFSARSEEEAFAKAEQEAEHYCAANEMEWYPSQIAFQLAGQPLIDGCEVWSALYQSAEDLESFVKARYEDREFQADS